MKSRSSTTDGKKFRYLVVAQLDANDGKPLGKKYRRYVRGYRINKFFACDYRSRFFAWTLTHIPSGYLVARFLKSRRQCELIAAALMHVGIRWELRRVSSIVKDVHRFVPKGSLWSWLRSLGHSGQPSDYLPIKSREEL